MSLAGPVKGLLAWSGCAHLLHTLHLTGRGEADRNILVATPNLVKLHVQDTMSRNYVESDFLVRVSLPRPYGTEPEAQPPRVLLSRLEYLHATLHHEALVSIIDFSEAVQEVLPNLKSVLVELHDCDHDGSGTVTEFTESAGLLKQLPVRYRCITMACNCRFE